MQRKTFEYFCTPNNLFSSDITRNLINPTSKKAALVEKSKKWGLYGTPTLLIRECDEDILEIIQDKLPNSYFVNVVPDLDYEDLFYFNCVFEQSGPMLVYTAGKMFKNSVFLYSENEKIIIRGTESTVVEKYSSMLGRKILNPIFFQIIY